MEPLDNFKYMTLLAKLESIKGTKGPINKFIKELYIRSKELSTEDISSVRYYFMLITRAIQYGIALRKCSDAVTNRLNTVAEILANHEVVTEGNLAETFEFWTKSLVFRPLYLCSLKRISKFIKLFPLRSVRSYEVFTWNIQEVRNYDANKRNFLLSMYIRNTISENSALLERTSFPTNYDPTLAIASLESDISNLQLILKESNEYISRSSTTVN